MKRTTIPQKQSTAKATKENGAGATQTAEKPQADDPAAKFSQWINGVPAVGDYDAEILLHVPLSLRLRTWMFLARAAASNKFTVGQAVAYVIEDLDFLCEWEAEDFVDGFAHGMRHGPDSVPLKPGMVEQVRKLCAKLPAAVLPEQLVAYVVQTLLESAKVDESLRKQIAKDIEADATPETLVVVKG